MDKLEKIGALRTFFPIFDQLDLVEALAEHSQFMKVPNEVEILQENIYINAVPLVLKGSVKVSRIDEKGREVFLYYITAGQSCAMTLTSVLRREKSKVRAITMKETHLLTVPVNVVYDFNKKYPGWQHFIIETFSLRFDEMILTIESVAFSNMHERIIQHLLKRAQSQQTHSLNISHQEIALDLATSREVISRILKQMEKTGLITLSRNNVKLHQSLFERKNTSK
ncbi:MAG: Crp/Fnr family transcriptional regulator [Saprospiraceae bacterium]|nr:Crp/Fnr family transcriptional regulator [Saprospiraceae bacterium]MCB9322186.1 Crp/Fnr family transcriptional regulator [Lewinellaceae bacterium]